MGIVDIVVKIGGGLLTRTSALSDVAQVVAEASRRTALLVVPGGGPFADAVRDVDHLMRLSDTSAHWMAVLAMDQHAYLLADRVPGGLLVENPPEIEEALNRGDVPVLAPSQWLRRSDPLPHTWDVTSDSIAAWVAGQTGARRLVLIKPPGATGPLVDPWFARALPPGVESIVVHADRHGELSAALSATTRSA